MPGVTAREISAADIHRQAVSRLVAAGQIARVVRGVYRLPAQAITEHHGLAMVAVSTPQSTVCLLSALQFHGIGTQLPSEIWVALDRRMRRPALKYPPL